MTVFMATLRRLCLVAVGAGSLAGVIATCLHQFTTVPLIIAAERFEIAPTTEISAAAHQHADSAAWQPHDGLERITATAISDVLTGIAFALILVAIWQWRGGTVGARGGALWGLAGFVAVILAPSLGLPPELPGTQAAALAARQLWWVATVGVTVVGLSGLFFAKSQAVRALAIAVIAFPHLLGAPEPMLAGGLAPPDLVTKFHLAVLGSSLGFWLALGALSGWLMELSQQPATP